ncbi:MAG: hypothetical protein PHE56_15715 [Bacteroidales bacterium]|nr:hypothetical protein [Bacteroidales bacterium]
MNIASIQKRIQKINEYKDENKKTKELLDAALDGSEIYQEVNKKSKSVAQEKRQVKEKIFESPENDKLVWKIKENQEEIKIQKEILAQELVDYMKKNNTNEISDIEGNKMRFEISVSLKKLND